MKTAFRYLTAPVLFSFALIAVPGWAQQTAPAAASTTSSAAPTTARTHAQRHADAVEQRIDDLHTKLMITDAQAAPWNAYAQTMRDNATKTDHAFRDRAKELSTMNADEAMKSYAKITQMHADDMQKLSSAWSALYATLSPDQKQVADEMFRNQPIRPHHGPRSLKKATPASAASTASKPGA